MEKDSKIYVAGHKGLVGSALLQFLSTENYSNVITRTRRELDLLEKEQAEEFFNKEKPEYVFDAAAKVGGIMANKKYAADFIYQNLAIQNNIIHSAYKSGVKKLLFLGSSCIYPKFAPIPIKEESLLTGPLEETNRAYAIAKITGIVMCQSYNDQYGTNFISVMPTNLYGPNDSFDPETSHVIPALIRKFHDAKRNQERQISLWGTGKPMREFLHVDDLARGLIYLMNNYDNSEIINIGTGKDISIKDLAEMIKEIVGYRGEINWDESRPDGTPRKVLDISKIAKLGFSPRINLKEGIQSTYRWFQENFKG